MNNPRKNQIHKEYTRTREQIKNLGVSLFYVNDDLHSLVTEEINKLIRKEEKLFQMYCAYDSQND